MSPVRSPRAADEGQLRPERTGADWLRGRVQAPDSGRVSGTHLGVLLDAPLAETVVVDGPAYPGLACRPGRPHRRVGGHGDEPGEQALETNTRSDTSENDSDFLDTGVGCLIPTLMYAEIYLALA